MEARIQESLSNTLQSRLQQGLQTLSTQLIQQSQVVTKFPSPSPTQDSIKRETIHVDIKEEVTTTPLKDIDMSNTIKQEEVFDSTKMISDIKLLNILTFKQLDDPILIQRHMESIENQLASVGLFKNGQVRTHLNNDLCNKFFETLNKVPECYGVAKMITQERCNNWTFLKQELVKRIASKEKLREAIDRKLNELHFPGWNRINDYIEGGTKIFMMIRSVYGVKEESRIREFVSRFIQGIPIQSVRSDVIRTMKTKGNEHTDWELRVPFADVGASLHDSPIMDISGENLTVCAILQDAVSIHVAGKLGDAQLDKQSEKKHHKSDSSKQFTTTTTSKPTSAELPALSKYIVLDMGLDKEQQCISKLQEAGCTNVRSFLQGDGKSRIYFHSSKPLQDVQGQFENWKISPQFKRQERPNNRMKPENSEQVQKNL
jgi:hypothetical protein